MIKKLQFLWLLATTFIERHKKFIIIGVIGGFLSTLLFIQSYPLYSQIASSRTQKIALVGRFSEKNIPLVIQNQLSLGLTALLPSGEPVPALSESWEIDPSEKIYTFYLKSDIYWHNGRKFTAREINYKIRDASIEVINNQTIRIILKEPFAPLLSNLSLPLVKPGLIGLGSYRMTNLVRQADYISEITLSSPISRFPPITYKFYPTVDEAILAFKLGEVDILQNIPDPQDLAVWKQAKITEINSYNNFVGVFFNLKDPLFKEKEIRQALTYAIPAFEKYAKTYTPISPLSWAYSSKVRLYRFDPQTAEKMLAKSALASASSEITITTFPSFVKVAQSIADAWGKVGVRTKIKAVNSLPADYQVLLFSQSIPPDPDQYQYWQSTQTGTNLTNYSNLKIDKLLEDGRKTKDPEKRKKIYADFQRYLVDDAPVIFLYYPKVYTVERK